MAWTNTSLITKPPTAGWSGSDGLRHKGLLCVSTKRPTRNSLTVRSVVNQPASRNRSKPRLEDLPLPDGSLGLPLIGNTFALMRDPRAHTLSCLEKYGKIYKTSVFGNKAIYIWGAENIQEVLAGNASRNVTSELVGSAWELFGPHSLTNVTDEKHAALRKLLGPFFTPKAAKGYLPFILEIVNDCCERLESQGSFSWMEEMKRFAFIVNSTAVLGMDFSDRSVEEVLEWFKVWANGIISFRINLPFMKFGKAMRARRVLLEIINEASTLAKSTPIQEGKPLKVLKQILNARDEDGNGLTEDEIGDLMIILIFAGFETTASTMTSIVFELAHYPEIWDKLRTEQQQIMKEFGEEITPQALDSMSYTDAVIKETMRLRVLVPVVTRRVTKAFEIGGYRIPEGWFVHLQTGGTTRLFDDRWMNDADEFKPERFLQEGATKGAYMPWGLGAHLCIGKFIAETEMKAMLAVLARKYRVVVENPDAELVGFSLTTPADGMPVRLEKLDECISG